MDIKLECDMECGFSPPPEFNLPPPPLPSFLKELPKCSEASASDYEMCSLIPYIDFDYNNSSMQASAMILLCSVLVLIFIFVSSIFVWKHKRKSKDSLPYKSSSSTGSPMDPSIVFNGYENPDAFMIRYKTLERQQQHFNMLQPKTVHYPSGFPMPQTPPVFICSSPGPDPYESNDNLYEELDSHSDMSHNDSHRTLPAPQVDRMSDHLNSSADTASVTDEITNNNNETVVVASSSTAVSSGARNALATAANESEVERRNRINAQMSNTTFSVATIFRDRNSQRLLQQQRHHSNSNYYAPSHGMSSNRVNSVDANGQFLTNPRAMHCWGSAQYEPVVFNSQCLNHHHNHSDQQQRQHFATMRNFNSLRSPHHINQNTINSSKNLWSWFRRVRT
ncbi:hypothetical protein PVAND_011256 [Polypedilum vanderplanki]|uniref:Uncharacterized protein n=1 Tax=Polypedilum vanderplanki TaxID=319348 RepID=A0A9J6CIX2_POLVA|nr:hypothetical protein PVAND_011256 [Polypedilum vanderplanki]